MVMEKEGAAQRLRTSTWFPVFRFTKAAIPWDHSTAPGVSLTIRALTLETIICESSFGLKPTCQL
jgi:hypothetical protein